ncbi:hypothetical protein E4U14_002281 [Claviceps sp. LM454 group G7]|nr:hypothetical protein E4U14_002281 [Claviceps sp. LM454 group G7]
MATWATNICTGGRSTRALVLGFFTDLLHVRLLLSPQGFVSTLLVQSTSQQKPNFHSDSMGSDRAVYLDIQKRIHHNFAMLVSGS